jgi:molybdopterin-guanine dinucleotide biosynthesis protein A
MADTVKIEGFVLAGGRSSRMGREKALLEIGGVPLIFRTARLVESVTGSATVIGESAGIRALGLRCVADEWPGAGPLGGIATALRVSAAAWSLVVACDMPYLTRAWLEYLAGRAMESDADAVIPMNVDGAEPLCAVYRKSANATMRAAVSEGNLKVRSFLETLRGEVIEPEEWKRFDSDGYLFKNMNTPEDYEEAVRRLGGGGTGAGSGFVAGADRK